MSECSVNQEFNKKIDFVEYTIYTDKLKKDEKRKIVLIADLHDYLKHKKKTRELVEAIKNCKPHHIVIAGDIIQGNKWEKEDKLIDFSGFLKDISQVAPVFISQGNHDLVGQNKNNKMKRDKLFKKLESIRPGKIFVLINDFVTYDNFDILGYTPDPSIISSLKIQEHGIAHDRFIKEYNENGVEIVNSKNIVEFVGHNPHLIARSENGIDLGRLCHVNTFYMGHLHNGYKRSKTIKKNPNKYLDYGYVEKLYSVDKNGKIIKKSINPFLFSKTVLSRGIIYIDDNSQRKVLQLRNNNYYINDSIEDNKTKWQQISFEKASKYIMDNNLHAVVITGGIRKFFGFSIQGDLPEVTIVSYVGK